MIDQDDNQYERLLVAGDAIGEATHAPNGQQRQLIEAALARILAALDLADAAIYLCDPQLRDLVLLASAPGRRLLERQGARLALDEHSRFIPIRAAVSGQPLLAELEDWRLENDAAASHAGLSLQSLALPLFSGNRLVGVVQVAAAPGVQISADQQAMLRALASRLVGAIDRPPLANMLRSEQEHTRALVDASNDAILLLDAHGRAIMLNRRAKYFFGLAERDVLGRSAEQLRAIFNLIFEDSAAFDAWLTPLLSSTEERAVIELKVVRAEPRLLQCFSAPVLDHQDRLLGRMLVFRDITREREVEHMKNEFVSIVSHELRTPLTSIRGSLQLVLGRPQQPELATRTRELLDISLKNCERLIRLINDILDISKIEQGSVQLRRVSVDPGDLCRTAVQEVAAFAAGRSLTIEVAVGDSLPLVSVDRDRALQVLTNLLSNAIKFSYPNDRIEVAAARRAGVVCFTVRDFGRGIAPEDHQRIFEKFQQIDSSLTRNVGGTGLGLAICKALIEEHGGQIWVESALGHGATFAFTLPLATGTEPAAPPRSSSNQASILVVDDNAALREALRCILEDAGYTVVEAQGGAEALQLARLLQPKMMTLDVMLPDLDGFDLIQVLRNDPLTRELPVLFISATSEHDRALALGGSGFLTKPFTADQLLAHVRRLITPSPRRVLVVDDDYHVRPTLVRLLQRGGFEVAQATDGHSALEQVQGDPPDLILLDICMPDIDGFEVLRRLKQSPDHRHIPVVVLTASDLGSGSHRRAIELGAVRYLEKPIASEDLLAEIEQLLA